LVYPTTTATTITTTTTTAATTTTNNNNNNNNNDNDNDNNTNNNNSSDNSNASGGDLKEEMEAVDTHITRSFGTHANTHSHTQTRYSGSFSPPKASVLCDEPVCEPYRVGTQLPPAAVKLTPTDGYRCQCEPENHKKVRPLGNISNNLIHISVNT